jgi:tetratricopeptide (TPR) repeat protein
MMLVLGCGSQQAELAAKPAPAKPDQDSSPQAAQPAPGAIPARAMLGLDELTPIIEPPKGKPEDQPLPERVRDEADQAEALIAQRSFGKAVALLERAVSFAPGNARILRLLGQAYMSLPNRGKAEASLMSAVKAAGDDLESHLMLGQLAASGQQNDQAIEHIRTALLCSQAGPQNPRAAEALLTLALLLDRQGYWSAAMEAYARFGKWVDQNGRDYADRATLREWVLRPERILSRQGALLLLLRRTSEAITLLDRAYRRDRTSERTASLLVDALLSQNQFDKVETMLLDMVELPSQRGNLPGMLNSLCRQSKDRQLPVRFWQAVAQRHKQDADIAISLARTAQQSGWPDEAMTILQSAATAQPNNADLWRLMGSNCLRRARYEQLLGLMDKSLTGDPASVEAIGESMPDIAAAADSPGAERDLAELARKSDSKNQFALLYLAGRFAAAKGKDLLAADLYQRATEKKPDFYPAYEALLESYLAQKRDDLADRLLDRMSEAAKNTYLPYYLRGKVALSRGKAADAIGPLQEASRLKKDDMAIVLLLADAYAASGRQPEAISTLLDAHRLKKDDMAIVLRLADAYAAAGQQREAVSTLLETLREQPDSDLLARKLFDLYVVSRLLPEARQLVAQLRQRNPDNFQTRLMQAELALYTGRRKEAITLLNQLSSLAPQDANVLAFWVRALLGRAPAIISKKEFDDAAEKLNRLIQAQPTNRPAREALADLLVAVGKTAEAAALYGTLFNETPGDKDVARSYVDALDDANQPAAALSAVEEFRSAKDRQEDIWGRARLIELLGKAGQLEQARKLAEQWISQAQDENLQTLYRQELLQIIQDAKHYKAALAALEAWIASKPDEQLLSMLRALRVPLLGRTGQYDSGLKLADELTARNPFDLAGQRLALAAMDAKDYDKCLEILARRLDLARNFAGGLADLSKAVKGLQAAKAATGPDYEKAMAKMPRDLASEVATLVGGSQYDNALKRIAELADAADSIVWSVHALQLMAMDKADRRQDARKLAEKLVADFPIHLEPRRLLIGELAEAKQLDQADRLLDQWKKDPLFAKPATAPAPPATAPAGTDPAATEARQWLATVSVQIKLAARKLDQALRLSDELIKADPMNADLLALKGTILGEMGKYEDAMTVMASALAIQPTAVSLNNNMGYMLAVQGKRLDEAEKMLRLAVTVKPRETAYADSLAWVFYKQGRLRMAGRIFQRLIARPGADDAGHGVIFDHAGDTYWRLGWRDKAIELWTRALELGRKVENPAREDRELLENTPTKIDAAKKGLQPKVSPPGDSTMPDEDDVVADEPEDGLPERLPGDKNQES